MHLTLGIALAISAALNGSSFQSSALPPIMPEAQTVEEYVRAYFADVPVMAAIASCESQFKHFNKDGTVVKNPKSTAIGAFQIMSSIHDPIADKLGLDITTIQGNAAYARYLYDKQGTKPWNASKACWGKSIEAAAHIAVK